MRTIKLTTSYEAYCSRLPGVIPAYEGNMLFYFDRLSLEEDDFRHPSNYGMIPLNLVLSGVSVTFDENSKWSISADNGDWSKCGVADLSKSENPCDDFVTINWHHISEIFAFFRKYYSLLNDYSSCNLAYSSATEYYKVESNLKYNATLIFGNDADTYSDFDGTFQRYGGVISSVTAQDFHEDYKMVTSDIDHEPIVYSFDTGFFKWLCDNVVPAYLLPLEYTDVYNGKLLFYPDVIHLYGWLSRMSLKYTGDTPECTDYKLSHEGNVTCCECEEYLKKGGLDMKEKLGEWLEQINKTILANNKLFQNNLEFQCQIPSIFFSFSLLNSVEDLGQFAILSTEWEGGINYTNNAWITEDLKDRNTVSGGTVVMYNGRPYLIKSESELKDTEQNKGKSEYKIGYKYDERFCKYVWGNDDANVYQLDCEDNKTYKVDKSQHWQDYTECYLNAFREDFMSQVITYAYDVNGRFVANPTPLLMSQTVPVDYNNGDGFIIYHQEAYPIERLESVSYLSDNNPYLHGKVFIVKRDSFSDIPYVTINSKDIYATMNDMGKFTFFFNDVDVFERKRINENYIRPFVQINGVYYPVIGNKVTYHLDKYIYSCPKVDGVFVYDTDMLCVYHNEVCTISQILTDDVVENIPESAHKWSDVVMADFTEDSMEEGEFYYELSGDNIIVAEFYKSYPANYVTAVVPSRLDYVKSDIIYNDDMGNPMDGFYPVQGGDATYAQPNEGETLHPYYNVGNVSQLLKAYSDDTTQYYTGNILKRMVFYYKNIDGTLNEDYMIECALDNRKESFDALQELEDKWKKYFEATDLDYVLDEAIYCDIEYNLGSTLYYVDGNGWYINDKAHQGVEYFETVIFTKYQQQYYLDVERGYNVFVYAVEQPLYDFESSDYDTRFITPVANIRMQIITFNDDMDGEIFTRDNGFEPNNGIIFAPLFRQEYSLNVSVPEYIQSNINIDRGVNAAFEKHLKLGEVMTFEALENYGNGYFNFLDT